MNETSSGSSAGCSAVDVVIVNYNAASVIGACLKSVLALESVGTVVVVDNASTDNSSAVVSGFADEGVRWHPIGRNLGFGTAANRGMALTTSNVVLLLNPDTVVLDTNLLVALSAALQRTGAGAVGPSIIEPDGAIYPSARAFPRMTDAIGHAFFGLLRSDNRWSDRYLRPDAAEWISGTAVALRREAFEAVGGFDERYFMYVEDVDLCFRMRERGWPVAYEPTVRVQHEIGVSSEQRPISMIVAHHRSLLRFAVDTSAGVHRLLLPAVAAGLVLRCALAIVRRTVRGRPPARH